MKITLSHIHPSAEGRVLLEVNKLASGKLCRMHVSHYDDAPAEVAPPPPQKRRYFGNVRDKGIKGDVLFLKLLATGPATIAEITSAFVGEGFAPTTAGPIKSMLARKGLIKMGSDGRYELTKA